MGSINSFGQVVQEILLNNYLKIGVGGMSEGLQILPVGILFQRLHQNNTKFLKKL